MRLTEQFDFIFSSLNIKQLCIDISILFEIKFKYCMKNPKYNIRNKIDLSQAGENHLFTLSFSCQ